jgi:sialate O-acetylesterase
MRRLAYLCVGLLLAAAAWGNVRLHGLFTDNMVLQRNKPIPVWGWAAPGEEVTVTLDAATAKATADAQGAWSVQLPARATGENLTLTVAGANTLTLKNLILGDIWVCSGQSNMEFATGSCGTPDDIKSADFPKIRRFKVSHTPAGYPEADFPKWAPQGPWLVCSPQTVAGFTAVGFFFAREVYQQTGVPIGLLDDNWGGTMIETWLAPETLGAVPEVAGIKTYYDTLWANYTKALPTQLDVIDAWSKAARAALAANQPVPALPSDMPRNPVWTMGEGAKPFALYNGMISPILRQPITGALWYQGESNAISGDDANTYYHKMRALIGGWRSLWKQGDFPFYYVQLANFYADTKAPAGGDGFTRVCAGQTKALAIPNTGMACIIDIGEGNDIHPKNKQDVGKRLALWALRNDYGKKDLVVSGPMFKEAKVDGKTIRISFDSVGSGLIVGKKDGRNPLVVDENGKLQRFAIAGEDKVWFWADAVIDGNTVVVSSDKVEAPVAVRYAYSSNPLGANLYNKEGLPAVPFRTDAW